MIRFVPLRAEHVMALGEVIAAHSGTPLTPEVAVELEAIGGETAIDGDKVVAVAGIMPMWQGTGLGWAWLAKGWRRHARAITERIIGALEQSDLHRVEMAVRHDYEPGKRWAERLGFTLETPRARMWGPDKRDYSIFVRLNHG